GKSSPAPEFEVLRMKPVGSDPQGKLIGVAPLASKSHYFIGQDKKKWFQNVPHYGQVEYHNLYPGVDLIYYGDKQQHLEYEFIVNPGASPATIQLSYVGAQKVYLDAKGNLVLHTPGRDVIEHAPAIYQIVNGVKKTITGGYVIQGNGNVGFQVGTYDHTFPLVIDPVVGYSSYLGGKGDDTATGIATDGDGNIYVTGYTTSGDFPYPGTPLADLVYQSGDGGATWTSTRSGLS